MCREFVAVTRDMTQSGKNRLFLNRIPRNEDKKTIETFPTFVGRKFNSPSNLKIRYKKRRCSLPSPIYP